MAQVAILLFLYSAFFLIGSVIALLWLPLRLFFLLAFVAGALIQISPQFDTNGILEYYIPMLCFILPSLAKTFGLKSSNVLLMPIYLILTLITKIITAYQIRKNNKKAWQVLNDFNERMKEKQEASHQRQEEESARAQYEQERRQRQYHEEQRRQHQQQEQRQQEQEQQKPNAKTGYKDPYEVLGVTRDMPLEQIRKIRNKLVAIYHPDTGQIPNDFKMKEINNAFDLIEKEKK